MTEYVEFSVDRFGNVIGDRKCLVGGFRGSNGGFHSW